MPWQNYILWSHGGEPDGVCEVLKLGTTFTTAFLLVFLYVWHMRKFEHAQFTNALLQRDTFMSSGMMTECVVEALLGYLATFIGACEQTVRRVSRTSTCS